jgi:hypothetical protein
LRTLKEQYREHLCSCTEEKEKMRQTIAMLESKLCHNEAELAAERAKKINGDPTQLKAELRFKDSLLGPL